MGLPRELMQQLQNTLAPLALQIKLDKIQHEANRLGSVITKKQEELLQAQVRHDTKQAEVQQVLAAIDEVKRDMDMPAGPPADGPGDGNMAETPNFEDLDDAFLGLNHQEVQEIDGVNGGVDPLGSSKRPQL